MKRRVGILIFVKRARSGESLVKRDSEKHSKR